MWEAIAYTLLVQVSTCTQAFQDVCFKHVKLLHFLIQIKKALFASKILPVLAGRRKFWTRKICSNIDSLQSYVWWTPILPGSQLKKSFFENFIVIKSRVNWPARVAIQTHSGWWKLSDWEWNKQQLEIFGKCAKFGYQTYNKSAVLKSNFCPETHV